MSPLCFLERYTGSKMLSPLTIKRMPTSSFKKLWEKNSKEKNSDKGVRHTGIIRYFTALSLSTDDSAMPSLVCNNPSVSWLAPFIFSPTMNVNLMPIGVPGGSL